MDWHSNVADLARANTKGHNAGGLRDSLLSLPPDYNVTTALKFLQPPTEMAHKHLTQKYDVTATEMGEYMVNYNNTAPKAPPVYKRVALNQET